MNPPRPKSDRVKCRRCQRLKRDHDMDMSGVYVCGDGTPAEFNKYVASTTRRSTAFDDGEVLALAAILEATLRGDVATWRAVMRSQYAAPLIRKIMAMKASLRAAQQEAQDDEDA